MVYREQYLRKLCPKCHTINSHKASFCYKCGEDLNKYSESKTKVDLLDTGDNIEDQQITSTRKKLQIRELIIFIVVLILYFTLKRIYHF
jgi:uncharacterized membrane protein YvbJ